MSFKKKNINIGDSLRGFWDDMKHNNNHITGISEEEEREQGIENLFE